jgi:hypothetical protein
MRVWHAGIGRRDALVAWSKRAALVLTASLATAPLAAQGRIEIGTQAGFTYRSSDELQGESTEEIVSFPGGGILGRPTIWATIFVSRRIAIEPHVGYEFRRNEDLDINRGTLGASVRGAWYAGDPRRASFYAFGDVSLDRSRQLQSGSDPSDTDFAFGGGAGYHWPVGDHLGVRTQALYRFWVDDRRNEIAVTVGFGVMARRR